MEMLLLLFILAGLLLIGYHDFRYRLIPVVYFPVLALLLFFNDHKRILSFEGLADLTINICFVTAQLIGVFVFNRLKVKGRPFFSVVGPADILILLIMALAIQPGVLLLVLPLWLMVALILGLLFRRVCLGWEYGIPLAGIIAIQWVIFIIAGYFSLTDGFSIVIIYGKEI
jgi:hypothetical protein